MTHKRTRRRNPARTGMNSMGELTKLTMDTTKLGITTSVATGLLGMFKK